MATVALPACLAFILVALILDIKESPKLSRAFWIPFFWFALCASKSITLWLYPRLTITASVDYNYAEGNPLERTILIILIVLGLSVLYQRRLELSSFLRDNRILIAFFLFALISVAWATYPGVALKRWIRAVGDVIMVLTILTEENETEAIDHLFRRCIIIMIPLSIVLIKYYRYIGVAWSDDGLGEGWVGVTRHKNNLGALCLVSCVFLLWRIIRRWPRVNALDGALLLMSAYLLGGSETSRSATALVLFVIGTLILFAATILKNNQKAVKRIVPLLLVSILIVQAIFSTSISSLVFNAAGRDSTFTGRVPLWTELLRMGKQKALLGSGFGSFWLGRLTGNLWEEFIWKPNSGHNGYIDVFLELGIVGLLILTFLLISSYRNVAMSLSRDDSIGSLKFTLFIIILFHNITESSLGQPTSFFWFIFLLITVRVAAISSNAGGSEEPKLNTMEPG